MRNPFRARKQRQTWEGRPKALTLDDPVFQGWDEEELEFKPKYRKSEEYDEDEDEKDLRKPPSPVAKDDGDGGGGARISNERSASHYNHDDTLGYAPVVVAAGALSGGDSGQTGGDASDASGGASMSASATPGDEGGNGKGSADIGAQNPGGGDRSGDGACH